MRRCGTILLRIACVLALAPVVRADVTEASASAESSEQPYSAIWVRNVFDLKPVAPPPPPATTNAPPANVKLIGITTFMGNKRAIVSIQEGAGPGRPAQKEDTYSMIEGQRRGGLEVLQIDPQARTVKIKNDDLVSTIFFETNKSSVGTAPAGGPPGMQPPRTGFGARPPGGGPFLPPRVVSPFQPNNPTGLPAGYPVNGIPQTQASENAAAVAAALLQQRGQAQASQDAAQSLPNQPRLPGRLGTRVTGTFNTPPPQP